MENVGSGSAFEADFLCLGLNLSKNPIIVQVVCRVLMRERERVCWVSWWKVTQMIRFKEVLILAGLVSRCA